MIKYNRLMLLAFGIQLILFPKFCFAQKMSVEELKKHWLKTPEQKLQIELRDKLQEALRILDNSNWHENDYGMATLRKNNDRQTPDKRTDLTSNITDREYGAMGVVLMSSLPRAKMLILLSKYIEHRNPQVVGMAYRQLVREEFWTTNRALNYARQQEGTGYMYNLLHVLPQSTPMDERIAIARELIIRATRETYSEHYQSHPSIENLATRILLNSHQKEDFDLIRSAVRRYPDSVQLWCVASRLPANESFKLLARKVYQDQSKPVALRCAAALTFGKSDSAVLQELYGHVIDFMEEFGTESFEKLLIQGRRSPLDSTYTSTMGRFSKNYYLMAILRELPPSFLKSRVDRIYKYHHGAAGTLACSILAKVVPVEFVAAVSSYDDVPEEAYNGLLIAMSTSKSVHTKSKTLIPIDKFAKLQEEFNSNVAKGYWGVNENVVLWD